VTPGSGKSDARRLRRRVFHVEEDRVLYRAAGADTKRTDLCTKMTLGLFRENSALKVFKVEGLWADMRKTFHPEGGERLEFTA